MGDTAPLGKAEAPRTIDGVAGADSIAPPPENPRLWCHHCNTQLELSRSPMGFFCGWKAGIRSQGHEDVSIYLHVFITEYTPKKLR